MIEQSVKNRQIFSEVDSHACSYTYNAVVIPSNMYSVC